MQVHAILKNILNTLNSIYKDPSALPFLGLAYVTSFEVVVVFLVLGFWNIVSDTKKQPVIVCSDPAGKPLRKINTASLRRNPTLYRRAVFSFSLFLLVSLLCSSCRKICNPCFLRSKE